MPHKTAIKSIRIWLGRLGSWWSRIRWVSGSSGGRRGGRFRMWFLPSCPFCVWTSRWGTRRTVVPLFAFAGSPRISCALWPVWWRSIRPGTRSSGRASGVLPGVFGIGPRTSPAGGSIPVACGSASGVAASCRWWRRCARGSCLPAPPVVGGGGRG